MAFQEENGNREEQYSDISLEQYGLGYRMIQCMGYSCTGPLGKCQEGIIEPIKLQTKSTNDKTGLGYHLEESSNKKHASHQQPKRRKNILPPTSQEVNT